MTHEKRPALAATSGPGAKPFKEQQKNITQNPGKIPLDDALLDGRQ